MSSICALQGPPILPPRIRWSVQQFHEREERLLLRDGVRVRHQRQRGGQGEGEDVLEDGQRHQDRDERGSRAGRQRSEADLPIAHVQRRRQALSREVRSEAAFSMGPALNLNELAGISDTSTRDCSKSRITGTQKTSSITARAWAAPSRTAASKKSKNELPIIALQLANVAR